MKKKIDMIVFPSDYFDRSKVDPDLKSEYDAVLSTGLYHVAIFDYSSWFEKEKLVLNVEPEVEMTAVHRGWMMKPEMYQAFYQRLIEKNVRLITTPEQYEKMHVFPNVYEDVMADTARMEIFPLHEQIDVVHLKKAFRRFMVKDYVPQPPKALIEKYRNLASLFYTVDYTELADGSWKIIEAGDGSVSGLSEGQDHEHFFRTLYHCFE